MRFEIVFHTPFRVASGHAGDRSDTTIDHGALLPASSMKGLMLSAARDLLKLPRSQVERVFGTAWDPSPWSWSDAVVTAADGAAPAIRSRARIRIDAGSGTVESGALLIADEVLAAQAEFMIDQSGWIDSADAAVHEAVLLAAARAVTAVGSDRRRGLGWVTVTPAEPQWQQHHLDTVIWLIGSGDPAGRSNGRDGEPGSAEGEGGDG